MYLIYNRPNCYAWSRLLVLFSLVSTVSVTMLVELFVSVSLVTSTPETLNFGFNITTVILVNNILRHCIIHTGIVLLVNYIFTYEIFLKSSISSWYQLMIICFLGFVVGVVCSPYLNIWHHFPFRTFSTYSYRVSFGEATQLYLLYYGPNYNT